MPESVVYYLAGIPGEAGGLADVLNLNPGDISDFDLSVLLIALAPEIDLRYERIYAYLQDDVTRRRPTVDLALSLLCRSTAERLERRIHFISRAPLLIRGLLHLVEDPNHVQPPLLAQYLVPDEQLVRRLLGSDEIDPRLKDCCNLIPPNPQMDGPKLLENSILLGLYHLWQKATLEGQRLCFNFYGPDTARQRETGIFLAGLNGLPCLILNIARMPETGPAFERCLNLALQEASARDALFFAIDLDGLPGEVEIVPRIWQMLLSGPMVRAPFNFLQQGSLVPTVRRTHTR